MTQKQDPNVLKEKGSRPRHRYKNKDKLHFTRTAEYTSNPDIETDVTTKEELREKAIEAFTLEIDKRLKKLKEGQGLSIVFIIEPVFSDKSFIDYTSLRHSDLALEWTKAVLTRDNFTCRLCGNKERLQAHHIKPWSECPEERFEIDNGITVCLDCHAVMHPLQKHLILQEPGFRRKKK